MPTSGYTDAAFGIFGGLNMPSSNKADYTRGLNGLWYYNRGSGGGGIGGGGVSSAATGGATAAAAGAEAQRLRLAGEGAVTGALQTAGQNMQTVRGMVGATTAQVNADLAGARNAGAAITRTADSLGSDARAVRQTAGEVGATADIFQRYAATLESDAAFARANALPWLDTGNQLLAMDENAGGMAGEWAKLYKEMSPDSMAATAATSTRKAASVAEADTLRTLARRGISAGSGAVAAALGKVKERESASVAAMMTSAHKLGLSMQADALQKGFAMALSASGMGKTFTDEALQATTAAAGAQGQATSALATKGSLQSQAANIVATQGQLYGAAGNLALGTAGTVIQNASAGMGALTAAARTQIDAQAMAADYYSTQGGSLLSMLTQQKYNVLTALFGR